MASKFAGRHVVITGGSSGIGKELARQWLLRGAYVTIVADAAAKLESARRELSAVAPEIEATVCDVADPHAVKRFAEEYIRRHGAPDVVVNNAGYAVYRAFEEMDLAEIARLIQVNFTGACFVTSAFLESMATARRGHIVMMASIAGRLAMTPCGIYSAAKHSMVAWAETLRAEVAHHGIRVHVVCPGRVETEFFQHETFIRRAPRPEAQRSIPVESVARATIDAVERDRFLTYRPRAYGLMVWMVQAMPLLSRPLLQRLMRARVASLSLQAVTEQTTDAR